METTQAEDWVYYGKGHRNPKHVAVQNWNHVLSGL